MAGQVDIIRDQRRGGIGAGRRFGKHGDPVGNAEGQAAPALAACRDAAHRIGMGKGDAAEILPLGPRDRDGKAGARGQVQRDVPAIVHIGPVKRRARPGGGQDFFGNRPGNGGHRRDENAVGMGQGGRRHAPRDSSPWRDPGRTPQQRQFLDKFAQHRFEPCAGRAEGRLARARRTVRPDDKVDRPVLQMQSLRVGQKPCHRSGHRLRPDPGLRRSAVPRTHAMGRLRATSPRAVPGMSGTSTLTGMRPPRLPWACASLTERVGPTGFAVMPARRLHSRTRASQDTSMFISGSVRGAHICLWANENPVKGLCRKAWQTFAKDTLASPVRSRSGFPAPTASGGVP
jgi:hypothetical protein